MAFEIPVLCPSNFTWKTRQRASQQSSGASATAATRPTPHSSSAEYEHTAPLSLTHPAFIRSHAPSCMAATVDGSPGSLASPTTTSISSPSVWPPSPPSSPEAAAGGSAGAAARSPPPAPASNDPPAPSAPASAAPPAFPSSGSAVSMPKRTRQSLQYHWPVGCPCPEMRVEMAVK